MYVELATGFRFSIRTPNRDLEVTLESPKEILDLFDAARASPGYVIRSVRDLKTGAELNPVTLELVLRHMADNSGHT